MQHSLRTSVLDHVRGDLSVSLTVLSGVLLPISPFTPSIPLLFRPKHPENSGFRLNSSFFPSSPHLRSGKRMLRESELGKEKQKIVLGADLKGKLIETNGGLPERVVRAKLTSRLGPEFGALEIAIYSPEVWQQLTPKQLGRLSPS